MKLLLHCSKTKQHYKSLFIRAVYFIWGEYRRRSQKFVALAHGLSPLCIKPANARDSHAGKRDHMVQCTDVRKPYRMAGATGYVPWVKG